jgi:hypothetical protein
MMISIYIKRVWEKGSADAALPRPGVRGMKEEKPKSTVGECGFYLVGTTELEGETHSARSQA